MLIECIKCNNSLLSWLGQVFSPLFFCTLWGETWAGSSVLSNLNPVSELHRTWSHGFTYRHSLKLPLSLSPLVFFTPVRLHILSTPYTEISPAHFSFNHLTLHSFMQFRKAFRVQVKGKNFQNTKVKQSKQATTDIKSSAESSLHFVIILSLNPSVTKQERILFFVSCWNCMQHLFMLKK